MIRSSLALLVFLASCTAAAAPPPDPGSRSDRTGPSTQPQEIDRRIAACDTPEFVTHRAYCEGTGPWE
jgi:hypothetical protein